MWNLLTSSTLSSWNFSSCQYCYQDHDVKQVKLNLKDFVSIFACQVKVVSDDSGTSCCVLCCAYMMSVKCQMYVIAAGVLCCTYDVC